MIVVPTLNELFSKAQQSKTSSLIWTGDSAKSPVYLFAEPVKTITLYQDDIEKKHWWDYLIQETKDGSIWTGFLSYDLTASLFDLELPKQKSSNLPLATLFQPGFVACYLGNDTLTSQSKKQLTSQQIAFTEYEKAFHIVKELILSGDIYQLNLTHELEFDGIIDSFELFKALSSHSQAPFGFHIDHPSFSLASISPELFVRAEGGIVETRPMKGTKPRGTTSQEQQDNLLSLKSSEKEQAELSMITDLMRNDLSKICRPGTVTLDGPFKIEAYGSILQQFSRIFGTLKNPSQHPLEILKEIFPGGSISGCPKERACRRIYEIEQRQRGPYTGCAGFWMNGNWHWNMAIRTAVTDKIQNKMTYSVGGGIVHDSKLTEEWNETLLKANPILSLFR